MQKLLVFTDIHLVPEGGDIIGLDPVARFQQGLDHALAMHPDARRVIITGDLAHHGAPQEYDRLRTVVDTCPLPVTLMIGNHDHRDTFLAAFPETPTDPNGFVQSFVDLEGYRLVFLDTVDAEAEIEHSGYLCDNRLSWLCHALDTAGDRKVILFAHHPPIRTGFSAMDRIGLRNRGQLAEVLRQRSNVVQVIAGHVHRTISGQVAGIPTAIFKSTCHQMPMALDHADEHISVDEPGAYGILLLGAESVVVLPEDFGLSTSEILRDARPLESGA